MNARIKYILLLASLLCCSSIMVACGGKSQSSKPHKFEVFQCQGAYDGFSIAVETGDAISIAFDKNSNEIAVKTLDTLKSSIRIGCCPSETPTHSTLFLMGTLTGELTEPPKRKQPDLWPTPWEARPIFSLQGWYVVMPFTEYPLVPEYESQPGPRQRKTLEATDFEPPIDPRLIHHDQKRGLFWIGIAPQ